MPVKTIPRCHGCEVNQDHAHVTADANRVIQGSSVIEPRLKARMNSCPGPRRADVNTVVDRFHLMGDHQGGDAIRTTTYVTDKLMRGEKLTEFDRARYRAAAFELWLRNRPF